MTRLILTLTIALSGCSLKPTPSAITPPSSLYDSPLLDASSQQPLTQAQLVEQLADDDVVIIGEYHGHQAAHLLQARLQQALYQQRPNQVLTMEQFTVADQAALDRYLQDAIGETELIEDANAWANYRASYRPLVEFAKQHQRPVIATNAPQPIVRCLARHGLAYLAGLPEAQRERLTVLPLVGSEAYRQRFIEAIGGSHGDDNHQAGNRQDAYHAARLQNSYTAQLLRDNTMATQIAKALDRHPGAQVLHLTGAFHSDYHQGTVAALRALHPELAITVISPVFWPVEDDQRPVRASPAQGDILYFILPLPKEYRDPERQRQALRQQFDHPTATCDTAAL
ncbi:ChaN family lipoprotein [Marinobacter sp. SS21]|uniref:ChaN family lipoprotein n=1 Tax=Marinobacter sp. SS21 TaxID=2979460 RepID=UPI00232CA9A1|nr:ChaN family lipoprotein [Marinobacter sp. SS21]MDC0662387.1 ChaN family lipoprotein [Marinobacter sp. SS21]